MKSETTSGIFFSWYCIRKFFALGRVFFLLKQHPERTTKSLSHYLSITYKESIKWLSWLRLNEMLSVSAMIVNFFWLWTKPNRIWLKQWWVSKQTVRKEAASDKISELLRLFFEKKNSESPNSDLGEFRQSLGLCVSRSLFNHHSPILDLAKFACPSNSVNNH